MGLGTIDMLLSGMLINSIKIYLMLTNNGTKCQHIPTTKNDKLTPNKSIVQNEAAPDMHLHICSIIFLKRSVAHP